MKLFDWFTSTPKVVNDVMDKDNGLFTQVGGWINDLTLTDAERLDANAKTVSTVIAYAVATADETTERSRSRRDIANMYMRFYLQWMSVGFGSWPFIPDYSIFLVSALTGLALGGAFTGIIIFHFGSHGLAKLKNK